MQGFTGNETATVVTDDAVIYHKTTVFSRIGNTVTIDSGGYETYTTTKRINQAAAHFGLKIRAYRKNFSLHIDHVENGDLVTTEHPGKPLTVKADYGQF